MPGMSGDEEEHPASSSATLWSADVQMQYRGDNAHIVI